MNNLPTEDLKELNTVINNYYDSLNSLFKKKEDLRYRFAQSSEWPSDIQREIKIILGNKVLTGEEDESK